MTGQADDALSIALKHLELFNEGDWDGFTAMMAPDVEVVANESGRNTRGPERITGAVASNRVVFPDAHAEIVNAFGHGDKAVVEFVVTGTHEAPYHTFSHGVLEPTGKTITTAECLIYTVRDGKVVRLSHYTDRMMELMQLGAMGVQERPHEAEMGAAEGRP